MTDVERMVALGILDRGTMVELVSDWTYPLNGAFKLPAGHRVQVNGTAGQDVRVTSVNLHVPGCYLKLAEPPE